MWACKKNYDHILGSIESDHKPLIATLSTKSLDHLPPHILHFYLRLDRCNYSIHHVSCKEIHKSRDVECEYELQCGGQESQKI